MATFASSRRILVAASMAADQVTAEVVAALESRGVSSLLLKGAAMASLLYDSPGDRTYADVDLLVPPAQRGAAEAVLAELGFTSELDAFSDGDVAALTAADDLATHAVAWRRAPVEVDLHRSFPGIASGDETTWRVLSQGCVPLEVCRQAVRVPSPAARALLAALHAAWHGSEAPGSLRDLARAVDRLPEPTWQQAARLARELGAQGALSAGLMLTPAGADLAGRLGLPTVVGVETALRARSMPPTSLGFERLAAASGPAAKLRLLAREIVPEPVFMRNSSKLARRGRTGLVLAYLWRPLWLLAHSGSGYAEWRRARRAVA